MNNNRKKFENELHLLLQDPNICQMKKFPQHQSSNTLKHSVSVAILSFTLAEKFGWDISEKELVKGALLHDYYLYNARTEDIPGYTHGISHPETALKNAMKDFHLTGKEKNIIRGHMWPLTLFTPPRSKEAILVCIADKYVAAKEMSLKTGSKHYFHRRNGKRKTVRAKG